MGFTRKDYHEALKGVPDMFKDPTLLPETMERKFLREPDENARYQDKLSLNNTLIRIHHGATDARTYKEWKKVDRQVVKGKGFHLWGFNPRQSHSTDDGAFTYNKAKKDSFCGQCGCSKKDARKRGELADQFGGNFFVFTVWDVTQTTGEAEVPPIVEPPACDLPLIEAAKGLDLSVEFQWFDGEKLGAYVPGAQKIRLATHDEGVFFHELAHAAHAKVLEAKKEKLHEVPQARREIVAELAAVAISLSLGLDASLKNSYNYIQAFAKSAGMEVVPACLKVLKDTEGVLTCIRNAGAVGAMKALAGK